MPRWDIRCSDCGKVWKDEHFTDSDARDQYLALVVSECCSMPLFVEPAAPNFALKGKGFHCVDYPKGKR